MITVLPGDVGPPPLARRILGVLVPACDRATVLADLDELYAHRAEVAGIARARRWYWRQCLSFAVRLGIERTALLSRRRLRWAAPRATEASPSTPGFPERGMTVRDSITSVGQDVRFAVRTLRRHRSAALASVVTVALAVGVTTAVFSVVYAVALRPLPYPQAERLLLISEADTADLTQTIPMSPPTFQDLLDRQEFFSGVAAMATGDPTVLIDDQALRTAGAKVTANLMGLLGVAPIRGRPFVRDDDAPGAPPVAIVAHAFWTHELAGDPDVIGRRLSLDGVPHDIVGVMPPEFDLPAGAMVWTPLWPSLGENRSVRGYHALRVIGRLRDGVTLETARRALGDLGRQIATTDPSNAEFTLTASSLQDTILGNVRYRLLLFLGAVLLVLLVACANIASLTLARAAGRQREMAVRMSLGARQARVFRQLLTENIVVAGVGGAAGLVLAGIAMPMVVQLLPSDLPRVGDIGISGPVLSGALLTTLLTGLLIGIAPALELRRPVDVTALRCARPSPGRRRSWSTHSGLVVLQLTITLVLASGAVLLLRSFGRLMAVPMGFEPAQIAMALVRLPSRDGTDERLRHTTTELLERVRRHPAVLSAAIASNPPVSGANFASVARIRGEPRSEREPAQVSAISPDYFHSLGVALRRGRTFTDADRHGASLVAIVNEAFERRYLGGAGALGRELGLMFGYPAWRNVVGVVADERQTGPGDPAPPKVYVPYDQLPMRWVHILVRSTLPTAAVAGLLRGEMRSIDPTVPVERVQPLTAALSSTVGQPRLFTTLLSVFAAFGLALAAIGLYGLVAYGVEQRMSEIGIRMALGADQTRIRRWVLRGAVRVLLSGLLLGIPTALATAVLLRGLVFEIEVHDPITFGVAIALVLGTGIIAATGPALRAARMDPGRVLRMD